MGSLGQSFKHIVTAFCCAVAFSQPLAAQETDLDALYDALAVAEAEDAPRLERQIIAAWEDSGSAAMDLLLRRAKEAMEDQDPETALEHFTALIDHAPDFAEGYYGRATVFFQLDMLGPSLDDLDQVLRLNPRHYEALRGLAVIMEELDRPEDALELYLLVLDINPHLREASDALARLEQGLADQAL